MPLSFPPDTREAGRRVGDGVTEAAEDRSLDAGFDPAYGARPLKGALQRQVLDPLAMRMLQGEFAEGDRISIDAAAGALQFVKQQPVTA